MKQVWKLTFSTYQFIKGENYAINIFTNRFRLELIVTTTNHILQTTAVDVLWYPKYFLIKFYFAVKFSYFASLVKSDGYVKFLNFRLKTIQKHTFLMFITNKVSRAITAPCGMEMVCNFESGGNDLISRFSHGLFWYLTLWFGLM